MAQIAKVSTKVEIKSPADKFYGFFRYKMHHLAQRFPQHFKTFKFIKGNDYTAGSVMYMEYNIVGDTYVKLRVEAVDEEKKSISYEAIEGDILKQYSVYKFTVRAVDGDNNGVSTVDWSIEFVKANEDVPSPLLYLDFAQKISEELDAYLINNY